MVPCSRPRLGAGRRHRFVRQRFPLFYPWSQRVRALLVRGHEAAGVVIAVGPGVTNLVVGQRVAVEAGKYCRNCDFCVKGCYNLRKGKRFCNSAARFPPFTRTFAVVIYATADL
jgi:threonine dehydrogenase-like Zn-dependent dehydrogenase